RCVKLKRPCGGERPQCRRCALALSATPVKCRYSGTKRRPTERFPGAGEGAASAAAAAANAALAASRVSLSASGAVGLTGVQQRFLQSFLASFGETIPFGCATSALIASLFDSSAAAASVRRLGAGSAGLSSSSKSPRADGGRSGRGGGGDVGGDGCDSGGSRACSNSGGSKGDGAGAAAASTREALQRGILFGVLAVGALLSGDCLDASEHLDLMLRSNCHMQRALQLLDSCESDSGGGGSAGRSAGGSDGGVGASSNRVMGIPEVRVTSQVAAAAEEVPVDALLCVLQLLEGIYFLLSGKADLFVECLQHAVNSFRLAWASFAPEAATTTPPPPAAAAAAAAAEKADATAEADAATAAVPINSESLIRCRLAIALLFFQRIAANNRSIVRLPQPVLSAEAMAAAAADAGSAAADVKLFGWSSASAAGPSPAAAAARGRWGKASPNPGLGGGSAAAVPCEKLAHVEAFRGGRLLWGAESASAIADAPLAVMSIAMHLYNRHVEAAASLTALQVG
ncbi:unnamed protein product, partial [Phaeothamnion confervicola]